MVKGADTKSKKDRIRREQQRAIDTREAIVEATLHEFSERGYEGTSVRRIAARAKVEHTLITYHFKTKSQLWEAVATAEFAEIEALFEERSRDAGDRPIERLHARYRAFYDFVTENTAFHHFMISENHSEETDKQRLEWLASNLVESATRDLITDIGLAQKDGDMMPGDPTLVHYMLLGMITSMSSLSGEVTLLTGRSIADPATKEAYWALISTVAFSKLHDCKN